MKLFQVDIFAMLNTEVENYFFLKNVKYFGIKSNENNQNTKTKLFLFCQNEHCWHKGNAYPDLLMQLLLGEGAARLRGERCEEQWLVQRGQERCVRTRAHPPLSHPEVHRKERRAGH